MIPSFAGLLVVAGLLILGRLRGATLILALFASIPFGSTAFAELSALGGSTPLIYTLIALILIIARIVHRSFVRDISVVLRQDSNSWILLGLLVYVVAGSKLFPNLFLGQTTAFVVYMGGILEVPLAPTSGNITQSAYLALGIMAYFAMAMTMRQQDSLRAVTQGFFVFAGLNVVMGVLDFGGKLAGLGDVLAPIRTANYSLLTEVSEGSFWRIVGAGAEASSFAIWTMSALAFTVVYWRRTGSRQALLLSIASCLLLLLSTSSTAYGGLGILGLVLGATIIRPLFSGRILVRDLWIASCLPVLFLVALGIYLVHPELFDPVVDLVESVIINKAQSQSGQERAYWNGRSIAALFDTMGLGMGMGSSRASSWPIAVLSQLGIIGTLLMSVLVVQLFRPVRQRAGEDRLLVLFSAARACALAFLVGSSLSGGTADPGILFFICLAVVASIRLILSSPFRVGSSELPAVPLSGPAQPRPS